MQVSTAFSTTKRSASVCSIILLIFALLACLPASASELTGLWRLVSAQNNGEKVDSAAVAEMHFRKDDVLEITMTDPENGIVDPTLLRMNYEIQDGNILIYSLNGVIKERQRFTIQDNRLFLTHLEFPTVSQLVRIEHSKFPSSAKCLFRPNPVATEPSVNGQRDRADNGSDASGGRTVTEFIQESLVCE